MDIPRTLHCNHHVPRAIVLVLVLCMVVSGCVNKNDLLVWKETIPSPDGAYTAIAETIQNGGFGSADIGTIVELEQTNIPKTNSKVIAFDCQGPVLRPYMLDNVANKGGTIDLSVKWISPKELLVTYSGNPIIDFQAIKYQIITIELEKFKASKIAHVTTE